MSHPPPSDSTRLWLTVLVAAWGLAFAYSFWAFTSTQPADMGFTKGLNRITNFLGWQGVAGMMSVAIFATGRAWPPGSSVRKLAFVPLAIALLLAAGIAAIVLWAGFSG